MMVTLQSVLLALALLGISSLRTEAVVSRNVPISGFATFYGGPQDGVSPNTPTGGLVAGACGYEALSQNQWPYWNVVAIGPNNPIAYKGNKQGCGYCIQATCTGSNCGANAQPVTLWVTDSCPGCAPNQLNLNALSFQNNFNSDLTVGRVNVSFEQVDCNPPGNILAKVVKSRNSGGNYIGFALMAIAGEGTITAVEISGAGDNGKYVRMANLYGDVWEASLFGNAPLSLRIYDNYGRVLIAKNAITSFNLGTYDLGVQFPLEADTPAPAPGGLPAGFAPAPSPSAAGLSQQFLPAAANQFCDSSCFADGLTASQFKKIGTTLSTFACGVSDATVGSVSGYQLSNASSPTCNVASGATVEAATDYACLCQTEAQTQGLQPYNGTPCGSACAITIDGMLGSAVPADSGNSSYVCVPISETSLLNRFGHTISSGGSTQCLIDSGVVATAADQFSCFCLFSTNAVAAS